MLKMKEQKEVIQNKMRVEIEEDKISLLKNHKILKEKKREVIMKEKNDNEREQQKEKNRYQKKKEKLKILRFYLDLNQHQVIVLIVVLQTMSDFTK